MMNGAIKRVEVFLEKCLLWLFEGKDSPFTKHEPSILTTKSQRGSVALGSIKAKTKRKRR